MAQTLVESDLRFDAAADAVVRAEERVEVGVVSVQLVLPVRCLKMSEFDRGIMAILPKLYCGISNGC